MCTFVKCIYATDTESRRKRRNGRKRMKRFNYNWYNFLIPHETKDVAMVSQPTRSRVFTLDYFFPSVNDFSTRNLGPEIVL